MNNEPVAWLDKESSITMIGGIYPKKLEQYLSGLEARIVALESHPAKTLTDEEVAKEIYEMTTITDKSEECIIVSYEALEDFARAILRKAQEK